MRKIILFVLVVNLIFSCSSNANRKTKNDMFCKVRKDTNSTKNIYDTLKKRQVYVKFGPKSITKVSFPNFETDFGAYQFHDLIFIFGRFLSEPKDLPKTDYGGFRLIVLNVDGKLVFRSKGVGDSRLLSPIFYRLNNESPIFILAEIGDEGGSWGNEVFMINGNVIKYIGTINFALRKKDEDGYFSFNNIGEVTKINKIGEIFHFDFKIDSVTFDPGGVSEKNISTQKCYYLYDNKNFRLIK